MKPAFRKGLVAPGIVAVATLLTLAVGGPYWALGVLAAGALGIVLFHLHHIQLVTDWAAGSPDDPVPAGRGTWAATFSAIYRRVRVRRAHQRDLRQIIDRFRQAAEAIPDGVIVLDAAHRIEWMNERAVVLLALDPQGDRRQPITNLVRSPDFQRYVESGDFREPVIVHQSREPSMLSMQIVPFGADDKLLLCRDVTQAESVARMRRDFIANVSHELKTPLTVVSGFVETMQDLDLEPRQRARYLGLMAEQARNMHRMVDDLLALSALESEHNPPHDGEFAVVPLLLQLSADAKALSRGEHEVTLDIGEAANITGDRGEIASAFGNLVSNAVRYTAPGGAIRLGWRVEPDGTGVFAVTDSGIGIAPEHIPRLTERFYRVDRGRSRNTGGTGLGLAIVKHVLIRHQAELDIRSDPGVGSTFAVRIPARRVHHAPAPTARDDAAAVPGGAPAGSETAPDRAA
jgi:two-component system phosphate regulon sensor histidine kinase PhoR